MEFNSDLSGPVVCNCSICNRTGAVMIFIGPDQITAIRGEDHTGDYQFGKKSIHHLFCKTCGTRPFGWGTSKDGAKMYNVNLRCVDAVDIDGLAPHKYDGRSL